jgi:hypothetical protein
MPLSVASASAAYMAAGQPLPETSPTYMPIMPGEPEMIQVIATGEGGGLKFVGDRNAADAQRLNRQRGALNFPDFVEFLLS